MSEESRPTILDLATLPRSIGDLLEARAREFGEKPFLVWEGPDGSRLAWTYGQFRSLSKQVVTRLRQRRVKPGSYVIIHSDNSPYYLAALFALGEIGAVAVTTNTKSSPSELAYYIEKSGAKCALVGAEQVEIAEKLARMLDWVSPLEEFVMAAGEDYSLKADDLKIPKDHLDRLIVQFTSGSTDRPKGVVLTHGNALWAAMIGAYQQRLTSSDVYFVHLPLFHVNAMMYSVMPTLWAGGTVVLSPRFSASRFWDIALRNGCTCTSMVPFCVRALLAHPVPEDHAFRFWGNAVCAPPSDDHFGIPTIGWWGMTETVTQGIIGSFDTPNVSMSIGRPSPGYQLHVTTDDGSAAGPGEVGDLLVEGTRGLSLFLEYLGDPEATAAAFDPQGRFRTGDRIMVGPGGALFFAGRSKEMLKVGGENVSPAEIERILYRVPGVTEAAVIGVPDAMLDEVPVAYIMTNLPDKKSLQQKLLSELQDNISSYKMPREIIFLDEMPRVTLGKISKPLLKEIYKNSDHERSEVSK